MLSVLTVSAALALVGCGGKGNPAPAQNSAEAATRLIDAMDSAKAVVEEFRRGGLSEAESERQLIKLQREAEPLWPRYWELSARAREAGEAPEQLEASGEKPLRERMVLETKMAGSKSSLQMLLRDAYGGDKLPAKMEESLRIIADWPAFAVTVMEGGELGNFEARAHESEALEGHNELAEGGDAREQYQLGESNSSDGNHEEALNWYLKSANQGFHPAMIQVGDFYFHGTGTPENRQLGYAWMLIASTSDEERWVKEAERFLDVFSNHPDPNRKMTAEGIAAAKELANGLMEQLPKN